MNSHTAETVFSNHHYPHHTGFYSAGALGAGTRLKEQAASNSTLHNICLHLSSQGKALWIFVTPRTNNNGLYCTDSVCCSPSPLL